jgi:adenylate cyclase
MPGKLRENLRRSLTSKVPLAISSGVTLAGLAVYFAVFIGERPTTGANFAYRMEMAALDARFEIRGPRPADPRILIVDIDQKAQEVLGRWPFHRLYFAQMLQRLKADGARVVAFDITFSEPDATAAPIQALRQRIAALPRRDAALERELERLEQEFSYDRQFAEALENFGHVVLGNFFLYTQADLEGLDKETLQRFADLASYHPYPQVRALESAQGVESYRNLVSLFRDKQGTLPRGAQANLEMLTMALPQETSASGFFNVFPDPDGVVRQAQLALPYGTSDDLADWDLFAPIDIHALRFFLGAPNERVALTFGREGISSIEVGAILIKPDTLGRVLINYRGPERTYPYRSIADVVHGDFPPGMFKDKIVLVGASATGIGDLRPTPFSALNHPGVEIHANIIDNALNNDFLERTATQVLVDLATIVLFGVPLGLLLGLLPPKVMPVGLLVLVPFLAWTQLAFHYGWWLNVVTPALLTVIPNILLLTSYRVYAEEKEKRRTRAAFQQYMSPEVIRRLLENPALVEPRKIEITSLFSDVRGFTSIAEQLDAQELAKLLNDYLTEMTRIVFQNQGTLDKYIGDAVMAFWGAPFEEPYHGQRACRAALTMLRRLEEMRGEWKKRGQPLLDIAIGINTGFASVGNMGSNLRYGYTVIGDSVNLASRLEALNRLYGTRILVGESTRAKDAGREFVFRELDWIQVKGKLKPVSIYELLGQHSEESDLRELATGFAAGLGHYRNRDWQQARAAFGALLARWPTDGPALHFLQRCEEFAAHDPGPGWDGVYVAKEK